MTSNLDEITLGRLRELKAEALEMDEIKDLIAARDGVLARYSPEFQPAVIQDLDEEVLRSFLYFDNNKHWTGLNRQVNRVCENMAATRAALAALVDESRPLAERMDPATQIKGMGKGIITAILHVTYPNRYGVWNTTSDGALVELGLMPQFERGTRFGERYVAINQVLLKVAEAIETDLWTLDALWWALTAEEERVQPDRPAATSSVKQSICGPSRTFALEKTLQDFLFDRWEELPLGQDWALYTRPGEPDAGYEFAMPIGRIDLLAKHRTKPRWLVIELKRHSTSDHTVSQILRYMGWIQNHQVESGETVQGLIIASAGDERLRYAVAAIPNVDFMTYEVDFRLHPGPSI